MSVSSTASRFEQSMRDPAGPALEKSKQTCRLRTARSVFKYQSRALLLLEGFVVLRIRECVRASQGGQETPDNDSCPVHLNCSATPTLTDLR